MSGDEEQKAGSLARRGAGEDGAALRGRRVLRCTREPKSGEGRAGRLVGLAPLRTWRMSGGTGEGCTSEKEFGEEPC